MGTLDKMETSSGLKGKKKDTNLLVAGLCLSSISIVLVSLFGVTVLRLWSNGVTYELAISNLQEKVDKIDRKFPRARKLSERGNLHIISAINHSLIQHEKLSNKSEQLWQPLLLCHAVDSPITYSI